MDYPDATDFICTYRTSPNGIRYAQGEMYDKEMAERLEKFLANQTVEYKTTENGHTTVCRLFNEEQEAVRWLIGENKQLHEILETLHGDEGILEKHKNELEVKDDDITDLRAGLDCIKKLIESYKGSNFRRKDGKIILDADDVELILEHCLPKAKE